MSLACAATQGAKMFGRRVWVFGRSARVFSPPSQRKKSNLFFKKKKSSVPYYSLPGARYVLIPLRPTENALNVQIEQTRHFQRHGEKPIIEIRVKTFNPGRLSLADFVLSSSS